MDLLSRRPSEGDNGRWLDQLLNLPTRRSQEGAWGPTGWLQHPSLFGAGPSVPAVPLIHSKHLPASSWHQMEWTWALTWHRCSLNTFQKGEAEGKSSTDVIQHHWNQNGHQDAAKGLLNSMLEWGKSCWVSYIIQKTPGGRKAQREVNSLESILEKSQNIIKKLTISQDLARSAILTFSVRSGLSLSILGNSWWTQCNKVLINLCPALRLIWRRINGGLSMFIFSNYGRW